MKRLLRLKLKIENWDMQKTESVEYFMSKLKVDKSNDQALISVKRSTIIVYTTTISWPGGMLSMNGRSLNQT